MTSARAPLSERLGRFAERARAAGCDLEIHHVSRGLVARVGRDEQGIGGAELESIAVDHAAALHGRQGYELRAVFPEGDTKQVLPFRVSGEATEDDAASEPANAAGVIALLQRQNERLLALHERKDRPLVEALSTLGRMVEQLQGQQSAIFDERLKLASMQAEIEAEKRRDEFRQRKWDQAFERFAPLLESVASKVLPGAVSRDDVLVRLAHSLDDAQRGAIVAMLATDEIELLRAQRWRELMASVLDRHLDRLLPLLRPEQVAMLDAAAAVPKANGLSHPASAPPKGVA